MFCSLLIKKKIVCLPKKLCILPLPDPKCHKGPGAVIWGESPRSGDARAAVAHLSRRDRIPAKRPPLAGRGGRRKGGMLAARLRAGGVGDAPGRPRQRFGVPGRREEGKESREGVPVSRGGLGWAALAGRAAGAGPCRRSSCKDLSCCAFLCSKSRDCSCCSGWRKTAEGRASFRFWCV